CIFLARRKAKPRCSKNGSGRKTARRRRDGSLQDGPRKNRRLPPSCPPCRPSPPLNSRSLAAQVGEVTPFVHGQRAGEDRVMTPAGGDLVDHPGLADLEK